MSRTKRAIKFLLEMVFVALLIFMINDLSAEASTFTYKGKSYDTANALKSYAPTSYCDGYGLVLYEFGMGDGSYLIYVNGEMKPEATYGLDASCFPYGQVISFQFPEAKTVSILFDGSFCGTVKSDLIERDELTISEIVFGKNFNSSRVVSMRGMFSHCNKIEKLDLSKFDTSNVVDMSFMFTDCCNLETLDLSKFDTSKVESLIGLFSGCNKLKAINISTLNTSLVTTMSSMFSRCESLENIDVSGFNTSKVTDMSYMFSDCKKLKTLNLKKFNTSLVTTIGGMFCDCVSLIELDLSNFDTSNFHEQDLSLYNPLHDTFAYCTKLKSLNLSNFIIIEDLDLTSCYALEKLTLRNIQIKSGKIKLSVTSNFVDSENLRKRYSELPVGKYNLVLIDKSKATLEVGGTFTSNNITYTVTKKDKEVAVKSVSTKASGTLSIPSTAKYNNVTYSVTAINKSAGKSCTKITELKIGSSVTTIKEGAFSKCTGLTKITFGSGITSIEKSAFSSCTKLTTIDFKKATNLKTISSEAFSGCSKLSKVSLNSTTCSLSSIKKGEIYVGWSSTYPSSGYTVAYSLKGSNSCKNVDINKNSKLNTTISGLRTGETYTVTVSPYIKINGKKFTGPTSSSKSIKVIGETIKAYKKLSSLKFPDDYTLLREGKINAINNNNVWCYTFTKDGKTLCIEADAFRTNYFDELTTLSDKNIDVINKKLSEYIAEDHSTGDKYYYLSGSKSEIANPDVKYNAFSWTIANMSLKDRCINSEQVQIENEIISSVAFTYSSKILRTGTIRDWYKPTTAEDYIKALTRVNDLRTIKTSVQLVVQESRVDSKNKPIDSLDSYSLNGKGIVPDKTNLADCITVVSSVKGLVGKTIKLSSKNWIISALEIYKNWDSLSQWVKKSTTSKRFDDDGRTHGVTFDTKSFPIFCIKLNSPVYLMNKGDFITFTINRHAVATKYADQPRKYKLVVRNYQ